MIYIVYVKAEGLECAFAFLKEIEANECLRQWGTHGILLTVLKPKENKT